MNKLGGMDELPEEYKRQLEILDLMPLWPRLRSLLPPLSELDREQPRHWSYEKIKPLLLQAGNLAPIEKAERRVLALVQPEGGSLRTTPSIYSGIQLILPGERAPSHRHNSSAARIAIETENTFTVVNDKRYRMERGDLIITPCGAWHEHYHHGESPATWLDILDLPIITQLGISYSDERADPVSLYQQREYGSPLGEDETMTMKFSWEHTKSILDEKASKNPLGILTTYEYFNEDKSKSQLRTIGFTAAIIRRNERCACDKNSASGVIHVIDGPVEVEIDGKVYLCMSGDVVSVSSFSDVTLGNSSAHSGYIIWANDKPLQNQIGIYQRKPTI